MKIILAVFASVAIIYFGVSYFLSLPVETYDFRENLQPQNQLIQQQTFEPEFRSELYKNVKFIPQANYKIDARLLEE